MFAVVWTVLLPLSLMSAHVGVVLWIWVALLSPNDLLVGFMTGVPFNKLVAATTLALVVFGKEKKDFYLDTMMTLMLLLAASVTISWLGSIERTELGDDLFQKVLKEVVLAFIITGVMTTQTRIHLVALSVAVALAFLGVKEGLISLLTAGGHQIVGAQSIGDNNSLATALLMNIPLLQYLARHSAVRMVCIGLYGALGLSVVTVIMTFSRGGFLGLLVLGAFMVKNSRNKVAGVLLVALAGVLVYVLAPASWFERLNTIHDANNDASFMGRVVAWKISWLIAMDHPLFGGGMHAVQNFQTWTAYRPFLDRLSFIPTPPADELPHAAHSSYFEVIGDLGFIGLLLFLGMLVTALRLSTRIQRLARPHPQLVWAADLARMAQISMVIYILTTAALSMAYFELLYVMLALLSRCQRTVRLTLAEQAGPTASLQPRLPGGGVVRVRRSGAGNHRRA